MGLTGIIMRAGFRLHAVETGWIRQRTLVADNIDRAIDLFEDELDSTYSVAWIDCMTRGIDRTFSSTQSVRLRI